MIRGPLGTIRPEVALPAALFLASKSPCTVQVPGGEVTYSTPGE